MCAQFARNYELKVKGKLPYKFKRGGKFDFFINGRSKKALKFVHLKRHLVSKLYQVAFASTIDEQAGVRDLD